MLGIEINNQTKFRVARSSMTRILKGAQKELKITRMQLVSLAFVPPNRIKQLNKLYRRKDSVTDVLSFTNAPTIKGEAIGEIIICPAQAKKQAKAFGQSFQKEVNRLVLHGYLHLLGYDHIKKAEAKIMESVEKKILNQYAKN